MDMDVNTLEVIAFVLAVISTSVIPLVFALKRAKANLDSAKNDLDREKAIVDMIDVVRELIEIAEKTYIGVSGKDKKTAVLKELADYAQQRNYTFDAAYWGTVIDNLVSMTNKVNIHK